MKSLMNQHTIYIVTTLFFFGCAGPAATPPENSPPQTTQSLRKDKPAGDSTVRHDVSVSAPTHEEIADMVVESIAPALPESAMIKEKFLRQEPSRMHERKRLQNFNNQLYIQPYRSATEPLDRENYAVIEDNGLKLAAEDPVSTFSIDVDTGSYSNVRRMLNEGRLPVRNAVRVEELINYFSYDYPVPEKSEQPFSVTTEIAPAPWNTNNLLLHIGLKGYEQQQDILPASNLVFLIDVSGSMHSEDKLVLLKKSLSLLIRRLRAQDRITLVVYAGASGVVLSPTPGNQQATILNALNNLSAGGSTNGAAGIRLAYQMAEQAYIKGGINRILLCTDGDFNVGTVSFEALMDLVAEKRKSGVSLSTFGFGRGNFNDALAEQLADRGNGSYSYIDSLREAQKVFAQEMSSSLMTIAKDVKIQIEFNSANVRSYRLIGYVNRQLAREDFNNDKVDAGEIGAGHTVTALYEVALVDGKQGLIDPLRYGKPEVKNGDQQELAFLKLRYKQPDGDTSQLISYPILKGAIRADLQKASERFLFSASVAAFGQQLRGGKYLAGFSYEQILQLARRGKGNDAQGYRSEFIQLVELARSLSSQVPPLVDVRD